jgi:hypothetical protein
VELSPEQVTHRPLMPRKVCLPTELRGRGLQGDRPGKGSSGLESSSDTPSKVKPCTSYLYTPVPLCTSEIKELAASWGQNGFHCAF